MRKIFIVVLIAFVSSCQKNDFEIIQTEGERIALFDIKIPESKIELDQNDALKIASIYCNSSIQSKCAVNGREIEDIAVLYGKNGQPSIYAVNFKGEGGFLLISATKKFFPIIAESDSGKFSMEFDNCGIGVLIDEYLSEISYCRTMPEDSLIRIRSLWREFEYQESNSDILTKSGIDPTDWSNVRTYWENRWQSEGKNWYQLQTKPDNMPQDMYDYFVNLAEMECNEDYPYLHYCYITEESSYNPQIVYGPLVNTSWSQADEYKDSSLGSAPLGCETVAVGQLMKFHEYPNGWYWGGMPNDYGTPVTRSFLKSVHQGLLTIGGSSLAVMAKIYLDFQGYHTELLSHDKHNVSSSIIMGNPVFSFGLTPGRIIGHSWVTCGYKKPAYEEYRYELYVVGLDTYPLPELEQIYCDDVGNSLGPEYFYQNWGWGSSYNGWFLENQFTCGDNFSSSRQDLICYPAL